MKHTMKHTLALLLAGVIHLHAQSHEAAIKTLTGTEGFTYDSAEAVSLKNTILSQEVAASPLETNFAITVVEAVDPTPAAKQAALTTLAAKGSVRAMAVLKIHSQDYSGWTADMVLNALPGVLNAVKKPQTPAPFKQLVFDTLVQTPHAAPAWQRFFKAHRDNLPKDEQIAVSKQVKDRLLAMPNRGEQANAFLASVSADLIALQLDP